MVDHDESLDAEIARIQAEAEVKVAQARGRAAGGGAAPVKAATPAQSAAAEEERHDSWDEFWAEIKRAEADERGEAATEVIRGVTVVVPHDLPLRFQRRLEEIQDAEKRVAARTAQVRSQIAALMVEAENGADVAEQITALQAAADKIAAEESAAATESTNGLLADLFGADVLDRWIDSGMTETELQVVLLWGMAHGRGQPMTFRAAYDAYREASGKAPTPAGNGPGNNARPTAKKKPRAATGGRSKGTSAGSTGSGRGTSRTSRSASS